MQRHAGLRLIGRGEGCPPKRPIDHCLQAVVVFVHTVNVPRVFVARRAIRPSRSGLGEIRELFGREVELCSLQ